MGFFIYSIMKHLKKYNESTQEFGLIDIAYILQDYADEGYNIVVYSATGHPYFLNDFYKSGTTEENISNFRLQRYANQKNKTFKFRIDFNESKSYSELVSFLDEMNVAVGRFNDLGFYLQNVKVGEDHDSEREGPYIAYSVEFSFQS
jgi:hypothetical protein